MNRRLLLLPLLFVFVVAASVAQSDAPIWMRSGHSGRVSTVVFTPDSQTLISSAQDGSVKMWDPVTGLLKRTIAATTTGVNSIAISKDGSLLAVGVVDGTIQIRSVATGELVRQIPAHAGETKSVAFSTDGTLIVSGGGDNIAKLWRVFDGGMVREFIGHTNIVNAVAISPDGRHIASTSDDFTVRIWDAEAGTLWKQHQEIQHTILAATFSPDGKYLAATGFNPETSAGEKGVTLYDMTTGNVASRENPGHSIDIYSIAFSADSRYLASVSGDYLAPGSLLGPSIVVSDLEGNKTMWTYAQEEAYMFPTAVTISPDGKHLAWGNQNGSIRLAPMSAESESTIVGTEKRVITEHYASINGLAFSPRTGLLASGGLDGIVKLWRIGSGARAGEFARQPGGIRSLAFNGDGSRLLAAHDDGAIRLWNVTSGDLQRTFYVSPDWPATSAAFSPNGMQLIGGIGFQDSVAALWDSNSPTRKRTFTGHVAPINAVAFSQDGSFVITGSDDATVKLWNTTTGELITTLEGHSAPILSLSVSADGIFLASASADKTIRIWEIPGGDPLRTLTGHTREVNSVAWSSDGIHLVSASNDKTVRVWNRANGRDVHVYRNYPYEGMVVASAADSGFVAAGTVDASVIVWPLLTTSSVAESASDASSFEVMPNPAHESASVALTVPSTSSVSIDLVDSRGVITRRAFDGTLPAGRHSIRIDLSELPRGVYFVVARRGGTIVSKGVVVE